MADKASDGLPYGQFGRATFDEEAEEWRFEREPAAPNAFQLLAEPKTAIEAPPGYDGAPPEREGGKWPSRRHDSQVKALTKAHPELQPAADLLPYFARVSEAVEDAAAHYDPAKGSLLAFGRINDEMTRAREWLVAFPSGPTGGNLRVVQVQKQKRGWSDSKEAYVRVPTIYGEDATWRGPGAAIQSLAFAEPLERSPTFLAVRLITATLIFRCALRRRALPGSGSRLQLQLLFKLAIEETGGWPHRDVTFNPWYPRQFAVVDQIASWSIWELQGREGELDRASKISAGILPKSEEADQFSINDGWCQITWLGGPSVVAVGSRRYLMLFDAGVQEARVVKNIGFGVKDRSDRLLHLCTEPHHPDRLHVLTNTSVEVYSISSTGGDQVTTRRLTSVRHFLDLGDPSLTLGTFADGDDTLMLLHSKISQTLVSYHLRSAGADNILFSDPQTLALTPKTGSLQPVSEVYIHPLPLAGAQKALSSLNIASQCLRNDSRIYSMVTLQNDLSIQQTLFVAIPSNSRIIGSLTLSWDIALTKSANKLPEDDFVVADDEVEDLERSSFRREPVSAHMQQRLARAKLSNPRDWTMSYERTVQRLNEDDISEVTAMEEVLEDARGLLNSNGLDQLMSTQTLNELAEGEVTLFDPGFAATQMHKLQVHSTAAKDRHPTNEADDRAGSAIRIDLHALTLPPFLRPWSSGTNTDFSALYACISKEWVAPLPEELHDFTRASREQLAYRMSAAIALSSHALRVSDDRTDRIPTGLDTNQDQSQSHELPMRSSGMPLSSQLASEREASLPGQQHDQSALPTPSATPSLATGASYPSFAIPEIQRLSRYTTFAKAAPPPLPRKLDRVLSHWNTGANPATYDWLAASRRLASRHDESDAEEMTEAERRRVQRRAERHVRRQRREVEESQRQQMQSSQAPEIFSASQPAYAMAGKVESQPAAAGQGSQVLGGSQQMPASQVVKGRHGGRLPAKKKRKSGF